VLTDLENTCIRFEIELSAKSKNRYNEKLSCLINNIGEPTIYIVKNNYIKSLLLNVLSQVPIKHELDNFIGGKKIQIFTRDELMLRGALIRAIENALLAGSTIQRSSLDTPPLKSLTTPTLRVKVVSDRGRFIFGCQGYFLVIPVMDL
jgi:hypothetical protein